MTNRHVVEGADDLELTTWDGRDLQAGITSASYYDDIAVIQTDAYGLPTPQRRPTRLPPGSLIRVVGYPEGGQLTITAGVTLDYVSGGKYEQAGSVLRARVRIEHGNSGGPVLDSHGRLVGIVFAKETATGDALIIPVEDVSSLVSSSSSLGSVAGTCS